ASAYDFSHGNLGLEVLYEWRKDLLTYGLILFAINAYRVFRERAEGEASLVAPSSHPTRRADSFRVSYRGRDTLLAQDDVRWIEAAGNYVILHASDGRHYMMRSTLKALDDRLAPARFQRVHRSAIVNLAQVTELASAEGLVTLTGGERIRVSRRLTAALKSVLEQTL
ncbi:MAG: LytTR family DNA-binding domain-containing protein, partial [Pseudomonadota bacterium]